MSGDVQPLYLCPHPTSDARVEGIFTQESESVNKMIWHP